MLGKLQIKQQNNYKTLLLKTVQKVLDTFLDVLDRIGSPYFDLWGFFSSWASYFVVGKWLGNEFYFQIKCNSTTGIKGKDVTSVTSPWRCESCFKKKIIPEA